MITSEGMSRFPYTVKLPRNFRCPRALANTASDGFELAQVHVRPITCFTIDPRPVRVAFEVCEAGTREPEYGFQSPSEFLSTARLSP